MKNDGLEIVTALTFNNDNLSFYIGTIKGKIYQSDMKGKIIRNYTGHVDAINSLSVSTCKYKNNSLFDDNKYKDDVIKIINDEEEITEIEI